MESQEAEKLVLKPLLRHLSHGTSAGHPLAWGAPLGLFFTSWSSRSWQSPAGPRGPEHSDEEAGGWPDGGWWLAGLMSVFGLIYEAFPRKDGFNSALEVWPEPYCRSISWAVKHFTGARLSCRQFTGRVSALWSCCSGVLSHVVPTRGPCGVSVWICRHEGGSGEGGGVSREGRKAPWENGLSQKEHWTLEMFIPGVTWAYPQGRTHR